MSAFIEPHGTTAELLRAAKAGYLVTGDRRHLLDLGEYGGIKIVTPRRFLDLLADGTG